MGRSDGYESPAFQNCSSANCHYAGQAVLNWFCDLARTVCVKEKIRTQSAEKDSCTWLNDTGRMGKHWLSSSRI